MTQPIPSNMKYTFKSTTIFLFLLTLFSCNGNKTYDLIVEFDHVDGLDKTSLVKISGMEVGKVKKMQLVDNQVWVTVAIQNEVQISKSAEFKIKSGSLLGAKYIDVDIFIRDPENLKDGDHVRGEYEEDPFTYFNSMRSLNIDSMVKLMMQPLLDSIPVEFEKK